VGLPDGGTLCSIRAPVGRQKICRQSDTVRWLGICMRYTACRASRLGVLKTELPLAETIVSESGGHAQMAPPTTMMELAALCDGGCLSAPIPDRCICQSLSARQRSACTAQLADWCVLMASKTFDCKFATKNGSSLERRRADDSAMRAITVDMAARAWRSIAASEFGAEMWVTLRI